MRSRNSMMQRRVYDHDQYGYTTKTTALKLAEQLLMIIQQENNEERRCEGVGEACYHGDYASFVKSVNAEIIQKEMSYGSFVERLSRASFVFAGVEAALEWLTDKFRDAYGIDIEMRRDGGKIDLDKRVGYFIFLAVRELLENVACHAKADHVLVSVMKNDEMLQIHVRDNGVGFEPAIAMKSLDETGGRSLLGIRKKVAYLGGRFTIESKRGRCTHASIIVPFSIGKH